MTEQTMQIAPALDLRTLLVIATWMSALLGVFLLLAWVSDRASRALAWWSTAYIIGGSAVAAWVSHGEGLTIARDAGHLGQQLLAVAVRDHQQVELGDDHPQRQKRAEHQGIHEDATVPEQLKERVLGIRLQGSLAVPRC